MTLHEPSLALVTDRGEAFLNRIARDTRNPVFLAEAAQIQRLVNEQRQVELRRQADRQSLVEKILFHFRRGMSRAQLERNWGREAVATAFDAIEAEKTIKTTTAVLDMRSSEIAIANARSKRRMGSR